MKRSLLTGILLLGVGAVSYAQNSNDDIYSNGQGQSAAPRPSNNGNSYNNNNGNYNGNYNGNNNSGGNNNNSGNSGNTYNSSPNTTYDNGYNQNQQQGGYNQPQNGNQDQQQGYSQNGGGDQYIDYDDDNYYATHIHRFNDPYYNMGYYSTFNNPYWYNPYWVDPLWGYNPWYRPSFGFGIGFGPYWSGGWGYNTWYGYGGFNSCWNYPIYGSGFYGGYYGGFWNGYYGGVYNGYGRYTGISNVVYGPRVTALNNVGYHGGSLIRTGRMSQGPSALNGSNLGNANNYQRLNASRPIGSNTGNTGFNGNANQSGFRGGQAQAQNNIRAQAQPAQAQGFQNQRASSQSGNNMQTQSAQRGRGGFFNNVFGGNRQQANAQGISQGNVRSNGGGFGGAQRMSNGGNAGGSRSFGGGGGRSFGGGGHASGGGSRGGRR